MFMTEVERPWVVTHRPAGHFIAPHGDERTGDVSNVAFTNGWILNENNDIYIYYASSDTRMHVATSTVEKLIDYCKNTPEDGLRSAASVQTRNALISKNLETLKSFR
jgi:4-O-beta-D-mannosyl-D-glucose phosphorylase